METLQIEQFRAVLDALKKIQAERTSGDWLSVNDEQRMQSWWTSEPYTLKYQSVQTGGQNIIRFVGSEEGIANARAIVASVNLDLAEIEAMEGLLTLRQGLNPLDDGYHSFIDQLLSAYLARATAVLEGLGVNL